MNEPIDFVIIWVDGNDPAWRDEKSRYSTAAAGDDRDIRYRDWGTLRYWFRGVERFAPWVNKIHFVTWGHLPEWLDRDHPKLNIVNHRDFIPHEYLPTFNSHTIELNLHRIEGLADRFVYFNDDMFITRPARPTDFFRKGLPCDVFALNCIYYGKDSVGSINGAIMELINTHFPFRQSFRQNVFKWYNPRYGFRNLVRTTLLMPWPWFAGFLYNHLPTAYLKGTLEEVWAAESEVLDQTCREKFRGKYQVNQWVFEYWQLAAGRFMPLRRTIGHCYHVKDSNMQAMLESLQRGRNTLLCINDTAQTTDYERKAGLTRQAFEQLLPKLSSFELQPEVTV